MSKWALITGATAGIGKETAIKLASVGYNLILCGRRQSRLDELEKLLSNSVEVKTLCFDIQSKSQIQKLATENESALKNVSVLINNAGLACGVDKVDEANVEDWDQMIDTNIKGLLYMTRMMMPFLKKHIFSDIINIGSVAGRWTYPGGAVYCATKHAVRAISEGIRADLCGRSNIRVCCIEPGLVETEFSMVRLGDEQKAKEVYKGLDTLRPEDIADTILWTLQRPKHVNIQEMIIFPTAQASVTQVHRKD